MLKKISIILITVISFFICTNNIHASEIESYAEQSSDFYIVIPKEIKINNETKSAQYTIECIDNTGDIESVSIIPNDTFVMEQKNKENIIATISQEKNTFKNINCIEPLQENELLIGDVIYGNIFIPNLSAGEWHGCFNFDIVFKCKEYTNFALSLNNLYMLGMDYPNGDIVIPETFVYNDETYKVTKIEENGFEYCSSFTSITLPPSIKEIGEKAFHNCNGLQYIDIPSNTIIGKNAFLYCSNIRSITFGENVEIDEGAFQGCANVNAISIPENIKIIKKNTFKECVNLNTIILPSSLEEIEDEAFCYCTNLKEIILPNSLKRIGSKSFYNCILITLNVPEYVEYIGEQAFAFIPQVNYIGQAVYNESDLYWGAEKLN